MAEGAEETGAAPAGQAVVLAVEVRVEALSRAGRSAIDFNIAEVAVLAIGERVSAPRTRGWSVGGWVAERPSQFWSVYDVDAIRQDLATTLLPDDAENSGRSRDWSPLLTALADRGIHVSEQDLDSVPQIIVLGERIPGR